MMVVYVQLNPWFSEEIGKLPDPGGVLAVDKNEPVYGVHIDIAESRKREGIMGKFLKEVPHALFLRPGKDHQRTWVKPLCPDHCAETIEIGINVCCDDIHRDILPHG